MKKIKRRSDNHLRTNRTLLLRNDIYALVEQKAYDQGHSMSSFIEALMDDVVAKTKKR